VAWDDTAQYVAGLKASASDLQAIFERNARRVYPRLNRRLSAGEE